MACLDKRLKAKGPRDLPRPEFTIASTFFAERNFWRLAIRLQARLPKNEKFPVRNSATIRFLDGIGQPSVTMFASLSSGRFVMAISKEKRR